MNLNLIVLLLSSAVVVNGAVNFDRQQEGTEAHAKLAAPYKQCRAPYKSRLTTNCTAEITPCSILDYGKWTWTGKACVDSLCYTTSATIEEELAITRAKEGLLRKQPRCACAEAASFIGTCAYHVKTCESLKAFQAVACLNETSLSLPEMFKVGASDEEAAAAAPPAPVGTSVFDCATSRELQFEATATKEAVTKLTNFNAHKCNATKAPN